MTIYSVELDKTELNFVRQKVNSELVVYISHDAALGLFKEEKAKLDWLRKLSDKLDKPRKLK